MDFEGGDFQRLETRKVSHNEPPVHLNLMDRNCKIKYEHNEAIAYPQFG